MLEKSHQVMQIMRFLSRLERRDRIQKNRVILKIHNLIALFQM